MEIRVLAPNGAVGTGFKESSLERGVSLSPHVIACDAGSTDSGPAYLGSGKARLSREACKRDLRLLLLARDKLDVPLIVGSCGTSGRDAGVNWMAEIALEIADEEGLNFRLALIYSDQDSEYLKQRLADGRIQALQPAPPIDEHVIERSHVVGMMGTEALSEALDDNAQVILAGRASDSALFAVVPERLGADRGLIWHAAKTIECGAACCVTPAADGLIAYIREDHFEIEPLDLQARVTPLSIAAHTLYENANPFLLTEPAGTVDTEHAVYTAASERSVRVSGSRFHPAQRYSIKLEGSEPVGFQSVIIGGIRDPKIFLGLDRLIPMAKQYFHQRITQLFEGRLGPADYDISFRSYGRGAVMGELEVERDSVPIEVGVLITVTAPTQELASKIATFVSHVSAHLPVPGYEGIISTIAYPFSPPYLERGAIYRFSLNHVLFPDTPSEMFRRKMIEV
ncbi:acyclic terpene utilization AtuA family protein [Pseudomonas sp. AAC]|uniref:acyclic terpene utilization AtuA family protein n=1 Tax=Pseudomonas sp. AAC TaxID=1502784 RepID=UPI0004D5471B|nr:acyclic terpene utilization AtuA family protein [Pseudomonas sp. AAC]KES23017.1 aldehyde dehydrogenase [Pseudomonas sp. AAC]